MYKSTYRRLYFCFYFCFQQMAAVCLITPLKITNHDTYDHATRIERVNTILILYTYDGSEFFINFATNFLNKEIINLTSLSIESGLYTFKK